MLCHKRNEPNFLNSAVIGIIGLYPFITLILGILFIIFLFCVGFSCNPIPFELKIFYDLNHDDVYLLSQLGHGDDECLY